MHTPFDFNAYQRTQQFNQRYGGRVMGRITCADGFSLSVQASEMHYCRPRQDDVSEYDAVEVGFPSAVEPLLLPYAERPETPTHTVYGWVPVNVVNAIVNAHGGAAS